MNDIHHLLTLFPPIFLSTFSFFAFAEKEMSLVWQLPIQDNIA